ncbi:hypothetical protein GH146_03330 [archaeon]|nr:hypothetical protein [archaeon]
MISDFMLVVTSVLLFGTVSALFLYYRRIMTLRQEYDRAKGVIDDIVVSVDSQFRRQKDRVLFVAQKMENALLENKKVVKKVEEYEERLTDITKLMDGAPQIEEKFSGQIKEMRNEVAGIKEAQDKVMKKLVEIEKIKQETYVPEVKIEGEKTAPEIREKIGLTREHSARLMKKLYKDGYLERDTHKMPYVYRLKEELKKILKKREASVS